ncbi:MAG: hypothetical protein WCG92_09170 [Hyphomicrobiales bacterium]|nr:hypothetical protein [Alphaproteobacteria bacterium]
MSRPLAWLACAAILAASPASAATPLDDLIKPELKSSACFARVYDAAHLRAHSKQKTAVITVWMKYEDAGGAMALSVALAVTQRGDPAALFSQGGCDYQKAGNRDTSNKVLIKSYPKAAGFVCTQSAQPDVFEAVSAEEGGALILDRGKDRDTLMVYLDDSLTMVKRANRGAPLDIKFGADDRVFLLRRTAPRDCAAVEEAVTEPEPGVRKR